MKRLISLVASVAALAAVPKAGRADILQTILNIVVDGGNHYSWQQIELPGTVCGNGSQYKFYVADNGSPNLVFYFEGGGACWDYATCTGQAGGLGASNPNGLVDNYMAGFEPKYVSPIVNGNDPGLPFRSRTDLVTNGWNVVYMPYCTGDVHVGNNVASYADPTGKNPPIKWHHNGYVNTLSAIDYAHKRFPHVQKLLVSGFSAGGTGTSASYYFVRNGINPQKGYMLNDSGPIYPDSTGSPGWSKPLHSQIRKSWALDSVLGLLPGTFDKNDFGSINKVVALAFPKDQLAYTGYSQDYDYSRFSYERFYTPNDQGSVLAKWDADENYFTSVLNQYPNFSYHIPWYRPINVSHCSTIITFIGSHACQRMEKKHHWWEYLEWPWGQDYKCYSEFVPMETFLQRFIGNDQHERILEPPNGYNADDPGMKILAPLINKAIGG
jgi:hypothetical protein